MLFSLTVAIIEVTCRRVVVTTATTAVQSEGERSGGRTVPNTTTTQTTAANDARHATTHIAGGDLTIDEPGVTVATANGGIALRLVVAHLG